MKRGEPFVVALVLVLATVLRLVALHADPPSWLSWSAGLFSDEGIYSEDSRLWVLYGQHMQGNFQIAAIAPLQYHLLVWVFRHAAAISLATARELSVAFSMATLLCFWATLRIMYGARTAAIGVTLLAFSAPFLLYSRMALLELPALFWLTAGTLAFARATGGEDTDAHGKFKLTWRILAWLFAAGALAAVAVAWKATFALGALSLLLAAACRHKIAAFGAAAGFALVTALNFFIFVRPNREEVARAGHYYLFHQYLPRSIGGVWHNIIRSVATGSGDGALVYLLHFAPLLLGLCVAAIFVPQLRARQDAWLWLWLALPLGAMMLMNYSPSRYFVQFWPALAGIAACAIARIPSRTLGLTALAATLVVDAALLGRSYTARTYTIQNDARTLERVLPRDAWIAGQFAPTICMESSLRSMYVQQGLANDSGAALKALPITHVLATRVTATSDDPWRGDYAELIAAPGGLHSLPVGRQYRVDLYANLNALP